MLSSPLGRALRTAELAAATTGATVLPLGELAEIDHGRLAGLVLIVSHEMVGRLLRMVLLDLSPQHAMTLSQPHDVVFEIAEGKVIEHRLG